MGRPATPPPAPAPSLAADVRELVHAFDWLDEALAWLFGYPLLTAQLVVLTLIAWGGLGKDLGLPKLFWDQDRPDSIGHVHGFYGNFGVLVRAFAYVFGHGREGLREAGERAVLNANYLACLVQDVYPLAYPGRPMHEFVATAKPLRRFGVRAMDVAKRMIDLGFHPSTVYFPLVVEEAMMVEPTETETKETLDAFAEAMRQVAAEAEMDPELLHEAPVTTPVRRLDEAKAARDLRLRW